MSGYVDALTGKWDGKFHPVVIASQVQQAQELMASFDTDATVDANGVVRWNSNKQVPPQDVLELWAYAHKSFNLEASTEARKVDTDTFLTTYRKNYKTPSAEHRAAARAAHGPGVTLVDVISGHRFRT